MHSKTTETVRPKYRPLLAPKPQTKGSIPTDFAPSLENRVLESRWSLAFIGLLLYAFVEYTSLTAMYPALAILHPGKIAVGLAAIGYFSSPQTVRNRDQMVRLLDFFIILFVCVNFLSACLAPDTTYVWDHFSDVMLWGAIYFLVSRILDSPWRVRVFLFFLLLLNLKLAQFTVRQYILDRSAGTSEMQIIMYGGPAVGSSPFFGNAADLGVAMVVVWGIVFALVVGKAERRTLYRIFLIGCFGFFLVATLLCGSRGAVVGAVVVAIAALAKTPKKVGAVALGILFLFSLWFVLPDATKERFRSAWDWQNDANAASRIHFWRVGLQMFADYPILGVGPGNYPQMYAYQYGGGKPYVCHSVYVQALAESGFLGTLCVALLIVLVLRLNARTRRLALASDAGSGKRSFQYCLALGLDLGLLGYLASGAFVSVLYYPHLWILLGLSVAANCMGRTINSTGQVNNSRLARPKVALAAS
jgi:putative inorganic carbon (hco3(-)) transporter